MARANLVRRTLLLGLGLGLGACSWTRFDDVQENAPVVLLKKPGSARYGFGSSVASATVDDLIHLVAVASPGSSSGAAYDLGAGQFPGLDAIDTGYCKGDCVLGRTIAGMPHAAAPGGTRRMCFATGYSTAAQQVWVRCIADQDPAPFEYGMALPAGAVVSDPAQQPLSLAAERAADPILMVGLPGLAQTDAGQAWFYASGGTTPDSLDPSATRSREYGTALAAVHAGGKTLLAVGDPAQSKVWLFETDATLAGCISGQGRFGRTLAAGKVDADTEEELLIADDANVHVVKGTSLSGFGASCAAPAASDLVVSLFCRTTADVRGCGGSEFGASIAVLDIDDNGDGEVAIGAPDATVRDEGSAGAVLVYDVAPGRLDWLLEARFLSSAESGDRLGTSVAAVDQPDRDILVAGGPGNGKVALFFCSKLLPSGKHGSRCD